MTAQVAGLDTLKGQIGRLPKEQIVALVMAVSEMVETQRDKTTPERIAAIDKILAAASSHIQSGDMDKLVPLALKMRHDLLSFVETLIEGSDKVCAYMAADGHDPMTIEAVMRGVEIANMPILKSIAQRTDLTGECVDRVVERGDVDVRRTVASNLFAPLFLKSQKILAEMAETDEVIRKSLSRRPQLEPEIASKIAAMTGSDQPGDRGTSLEKFPISSHARATIETLLELGDRTRTNPNNTLTPQKIDELADLKKISFDEQLVLYASGDHLVHASESLAMALQVSRGRIVTMVGNSDDLELAAVCYHLGLNPAVFAVMAQAFDRRHRRPARPLNKLVATFFSLNPNRFRTFLEQLGTSVPRKKQKGEA